MQNTSAHGSGDDYEWDVQNMLLDQCLAEEEEDEEEEGEGEGEGDYVEYVNDDMNVGTAPISCTTAASTRATWTCSTTNESGGGGRRSLLIPNPAAGIKARGAVRRRSRTNRASSRKTTLVKANPANFRDLVQQFTGCHSRLPYPPLSLQGKGPINLNFAHYTATNPTPTPTPTCITYHPTNISHHPPPPPPPGLQQQQGGHHSDRLNLVSFPTGDNNNNVNDATTAVSATDHPQYPPPPPSFTSFSSDHEEMELITQGQFTMWETDDQHHYY